MPARVSDPLLDRIVAEMDQMRAIESAAIRWMHLWDPDDPTELATAGHLARRAHEEHVGLAFRYIGANEEARGR